MVQSRTNDSQGAFLFVVDDEPMLLELAMMVLEPLGYRVKTFRDPATALEAFKSAEPRPDLIVTDYAMHNMNGMDRNRECRRVSPKQKILLISGTVDETIYYGLPDKPDRFLAKPYLANQLGSAIAQLLAK